MLKKNDFTTVATDAMHLSVTNNGDLNYKFKKFCISSLMRNTHRTVVVG